MVKRKRKPRLEPWTRFWYFALILVAVALALSGIAFIPVAGVQFPLVLFAFVLGLGGAKLLQGMFWNRWDWPGDRPALEHYLAVMFFVSLACFVLFFAAVLPYHEAIGTAPPAKERPPRTSPDR